MIKFLYIFCFLIFLELKSEYHQSGIDTVYNFKPGKGQSLGQSFEFFPANIFGMPDTNASELTPASDPKQICSIGLGGTIIVGFKNYLIVDGDGPDFTIFENAFINPVTKKVFAEPAIVSVSEDGIYYYDFPYDPITLKGCAGITPTNGKENPFNPLKSGGDKFDLATIGLSRVKYIRIKDICQEILDNPNHPFFDPIISGFDLDAVVGLNLMSDISNSRNEQQNHSKLQLIRKSHCYEIISEVPKNVYVIYDYLGREILHGIFDYQLVLENSHLTDLVYFLIIQNKSNLHYFNLFF